MGKSALVIGGCGTVGHLLAPVLSEAEVHHRWFSFDLHKCPECPWGSVFVGDVTDIGDLFRYTQHTDAILYMPMGDLDDPASLFEVGVYGFYNALVVAKQANVECVMLMSSMSVHGGKSPTNPSFHVDDRKPPYGDSPYQVAKLAAEAVGRHFAEAYRMTVYSLRIGCPTPDDEVRASRELPYYNPSLLAVSDLSEAITTIVKCGRSPGYECLHLTGDIRGEQVDMSRAKVLLNWGPTI